MNKTSIKLKKVLSLAIISCCERQSNAFERSVRNAPKTFPLSTLHFHFSYIVIRQFRARYFFLKPYWNFDKNLFRSQVPVLKTGKMWACFEILAQVTKPMHLLKSRHMQSMLAFFFIIFIGLSVLWIAFLVPDALISLIISPTGTFEKLRVCSQKHLDGFEISI